MPLTSLSDSLKGGLETDPWMALQPDAQPRPAPMEPPAPQMDQGFMALLMKLLQAMGGGAGRRPPGAPGFMDPPPSMR